MNTTRAAMNGAVMSRTLGILEVDTQNNGSDDGEGWSCVAQKCVYYVVYTTEMY